LPHKWVVNILGLIWRGGNQNEGELLERCYRNSILKAAEIGVKPVAFCSISTGAYRFPIDLAAPITLKAIAPIADQFVKVLFVMNGDREFEVFHNSLQQLQ
jgi:O-acetyl-ADP-ribose deacetylase (regulator of RNase III)